MVFQWRFGFWYECKYTHWVHLIRISPQDKNICSFFLLVAFVQCCQRWNISYISLKFSAIFLHCPIPTCLANVGDESIANSYICNGNGSSTDEPLIKEIGWHFQLQQRLRGSRTHTHTPNSILIWTNYLFNKHSMQTFFSTDVDCDQ